MRINEEATTILTERIAAKLSLRELSDMLGHDGFSPAKLSLVERGLIPVTAHDEKLILATIRRVAQLSRARKGILASARQIDLGEFVSDLREGRAAVA